MIKKKRVVFISHDASRTGAPILLLRLMETIKQRDPNLELIALLKNGGELKPGFEAFCPTYIWEHESPYKKPMRQRVKDGFTFNKQAPNAAFLKIFAGADVVFANTITNAPLLQRMPLEGKKLFCYFHELDLITQLYSTPEDIAYLGAVSNKIFVPSLAVKTFFTETHGIAPEKLVFLNYVIPTEASATLTVPEAANHTLFSKAESKFVVAFCGTLQWRKGYDLLPQLIQKIVTEKGQADIHFLWIGADEDSLECKILKSDLGKLGLAESFSFLPAVNNISGYLQQVDLFALPSREDAFPLVVLEAAAKEIPTVCFAKGGGIPEFVGSDAGVVVDYLDVEAMAGAIVELKNNPERRMRLGKAAKEKLIQYTVGDTTVNQLIALLN